MSEQITITLSNEIYRQIAQQATLNRQNISDVVHDVVVRTFTSQNTPVNPARDKMLQEVEAYKKLHPALVKTHLGQFIAIFQKLTLIFKKTWLIRYLALTPSFVSGNLYHDYNNVTLTTIGV